MTTFWRLLEQSTITTFFITLGVIGAAIYCWVSGIEIPDTLHTAMTLILGFFFGVKSQVMINNHKVQSTG